MATLLLDKIGISYALKSYREAELGEALAKIRGRCSILELGGDSGFQASLLVAQGHAVVSLDLPPEPGDTRRSQYHPVQSYDGLSLPFPDHAFDLVFTSNTLEHATSLRPLLGETFRVLKPGGQAIHILPTVSWRFWASLGYVPFQLGRALKRLALRLTHGRPETLLPEGWRGLFLEKPHGAFPSVCQEFLTYRTAWWKRQFEVAGFEVVSTCPTGLFYTPYFWLPRLPLRIRHGLSRLLGSSCRIYFLQRPNHGA